MRSLCRAQSPPDPTRHRRENANVLKRSGNADKGHYVKLANGKAAGQTQYQRMLDDLLDVPRSIAVQVSDDKPGPRIDPELASLCHLVLQIEARLNDVEFQLHNGHRVIELQGIVRAALARINERVTWAVS